MAHQKPTGTAKTLSEDVKEQIIHEVVPVVAAFVADVTPKGLKENKIWRIAQPLLSVAIARITPDGGAWETVDRIRTEFFSEYRQAMTKKESASPDGSMVATPRLVRGLLALTGEELDATMTWLATFREAHPDLASNALQRLEKLSKSEIRNFARMGLAEKSAYMETALTRVDEAKKDPIGDFFRSEVWQQRLQPLLQKAYGVGKKSAQWVRDHISSWCKDARRLVIILLALFFGLLIAGGIIAASGAPTVGRFFILGAGLGATLVFCILVLRSVGVLAFAIGGAAVSDAVKDKNVTEAVQIPLRMAMSAMAWITAVSLLFAVLPVWQYLWIYFGLLSAVAFFAFSGIGWNRSPKLARAMATIVIVAASSCMVALSIPPVKSRWDRIVLATEVATDHANEIATAKAEAARKVNALSEAEYRDALKRRSYFLTKKLENLTLEEREEYQKNEAAISKTELEVFGRPSTSAPKTSTTVGALEKGLSGAKLKVPAKTTPPPPTAPPAAKASDTDREILEYIEKEYPDL